MGLGTNILLLSISISFIMTLGGFPSTLSSILGYSLSPDAPGGAPSFNTNVQSAIMALLTLSVGVAILAGVLSFPNPYSLFSPLITFFLGFATMPMAVFQEGVLPNELKVFFGLIFGFLYLMASLAFIHGAAEL